MRARLACLLLSAAAAGCGGGGRRDTSANVDPAGSDRQRVAAVVRGYLRALADRDASAACATLSVTAQEDLATAGGAPSCEDAAAALAKLASGSDRAGMRRARVLDTRVHGTKATVRVTGDGQAPRTVPLEKDDGEWKIAGFEGNVHFTSTEEAQCITGGLQTYDDRKAPRFWYREGRDDFRTYMQLVCRRAEERGILTSHTTARQMAPIARRVIREMAQRGQISLPG